MNKTEIFQILGIEETKDEGLIKRAYREKLTVTNPEDNPEGFKRLRTAYEEACVLAKKEEETEQKEEDLTPSGIWVAKADDIYHDMTRRQDVKCWEELFAEDIFLSLEEEENCSIKLLRFLMEHFKLPTEVWKLVDEHLHITLEGNRYREYFPADFMNYVVNRCRNGEDLEFGQFEGAPDADYDLFLQYNDQCWEALMQENLDQAQEYLNNADDLEIYHPVMELNRARLWEKQGKIEEAIEWMVKLRSRLADDLMIDYHTAEMLWRNERHGEAGKIYEKIKENNKKHYMSNRRLTELYYEEKRYKDAKKCAEEVIGMGGADDLRDLLAKINCELEKSLEKDFKENPTCETGLELGWCYLQDCRFCEGIRHALDLKELITEEKDSEYKGLLTKLYVESADYSEALEMAKVWEKALYKKMQEEQAKEQNEERIEARKKNEDRVRQSYAIRAYCYSRLGYKEKENFNKAIEHIEKAEQLAEKDKPDFNMMLEKAQIYLDLEEYEKCLQVSNELIEKYQIFAAYASAQKAYSRMWDAQGVVQSGYECIRHFPEYVKSYERIAKVYLDLKYTEDLKKLLQQAKDAKVKSVFLDAYEYQMNHERPDEDSIDKKIEHFRENYLKKVENGQLDEYEKGLEVISECLYFYPGPYLMVERALYHRAACKYEEAIDDFESALAEEPDNPYAHNGLAYIYRLQGQYEKAMVCVKKAILYFEEEYTKTFADRGDLYTLMGLNRDALNAYEEVLRVGGEDIRKNRYYMRRYAYVLVRNERMEDAVRVLSEVYADPLERYEELTELYYRSGREKETWVALEQWKKALHTFSGEDKAERQAEYYGSLAWAELVFGSGLKAIEYLEKKVKMRANPDDNAGTYGDIIFACLLNGDEKKAGVYVQKLRDIMQKQASTGVNACHEMDKIALEREFMTKYFTAGEEELAEILEREKKTNICYFCTECACKEMEGLRVLHLLRMGKTKEAFELVERIQNKNSLDDWMRAIRNLCKDGVKVVPYNGQQECSDKVSAEQEEKGIGNKIKGLFNNIFRG